MMPLPNKNRFIRMLPGRIRVEISGLQGNSATAERISHRFAAVKGVRKIDPCIVSGRLLLLYDEKKLTLQDIWNVIRELEEGVCASSAGDAPSTPPEPPQAAAGQMADAKREAAVAAEGEQDRQRQQEPSFPHGSAVRGEWDPAKVVVTVPIHAPPAERIPLPLALSMGGLTALGLKRLLVGSSALSRSPIPFYMSGLVAAITGYPLLRRGFHTFSRTGRWNPDLLLGAGALALALVRENLVVLAGLSLLQHVNWKRSRIPSLGGESAALPADIQSYGEKAGKWGMAAAAAAWAVTRDPLRGLAVLLAANPRPATVSADFAWKHAELAARERGLVSPAGGSLPRLARTRTLLVEDASLLFGPFGPFWPDAPNAPNGDSVECIAHSEDADKTVCLAAALLKRSRHPWKEEIWQKAEESCRTIRTAFQVTEDENGIQGAINGAAALVGNLDYLRQNGIVSNNYLMDAKRLEKNGFRVLYVAAETPQARQCIGLIVRRESGRPGEFGELQRRFAAKGWRIAVLRNERNLDAGMLREQGADTGWLSLEPGEIAERIALLHAQGEEVLLAARSEGGSTWIEYLKETGLPCMTPDRLHTLLETAEYANRIDQTVNRHVRLTKGWNVVGSVLAFTGAISAPVANLAADALSLLFMSQSKRIGGASASAPPFADAAHLETAAACEMETDSETAPWHALSADQVQHTFRVHEKSGLSSDQAAAQKTRYGPNRLESRTPTPWYVSYLGQFKEFTTLILLGTVTVAFCTGGWIDGIAMGTILLANAAVGTFQERKAQKVLEALNRYQPPVCRILRDGQPSEITGAELVPGDIVLLEAGDRIPADIRLIHAWNLRANEAALTGESLPVDKTEASLEPDCPLPDRNNMLFTGTDICSGKCVGVVVRTGMNTEMGRLAALLKKEEKEVTPLQQKVTAISKNFVNAALAAAAILFVTGMLRGIPLAQMTSTSVTLAASAIPEGLPVTITIALSAGIFRMAKKNTLIRKLSALETLGRTTIICTDKTGTLTKNEMTVKTVATVGRAWTVSGTGYDPAGSFEEVAPEVAAAAAGTAEEQPPADTSEHPDLRRLLEIGMLCNNSRLEQSGGEWSVKGDPTEGALLALSAKNGLWPDQMDGWCRGLEIPFDSGTGKMSVVCHENADRRKCFVFSKGGVEIILRHCSHYQVDGKVLPLTEENKKLILLRNEQFSREALRVLAFSYRSVDPQEQETGIDEKNMIYVGMTGMIDPPKPDVEASIREAFTLGVKPVMITGDHPITALAIAKQLGIYDGSRNVLSGHEISRLTDEELFEIVEDIAIFARVTPEHKLRIVRAFQQRGQIVAMTGDGVNDTPAIKQADVGIAMGKTGTEVTKETADMVLQEDSFGAIVEAVKEGRTIMGNIRKALGCLLTGNLAEIIVTSAAVIAGLPIPLAPIQILLMNLLTDALPAMILAVNPGNKTTRTARTDIVDKDLYHKIAVKGVLLGLGSLGLFAASLAAGAPVPVAQSVAFATLVAGQLIQTFSWRQEGSEETVRDWARDRFLIGALSLSWLALLAALYIPPLSGFFHTVPLSWRYWPPILAAAGSISLLSKPLLAVFTRRQGQIPQAEFSRAAAAA